MVYPPQLRRTATIAAIVGTWLTLFNQGEVLLVSGITTSVAVKIVLNYLTPFVVSNLGALSATRPKGDDDRTVAWGLGDPLAGERDS